MGAISLQPDRPATFRLAFAPDFAAARSAAAAVRGFLAEQGVLDNDLFACELCVAEACNNAIEYAQGEYRESSPFVDAICTPAAIELRVTDHTAGFELPARSEVPKPPSERGRGVFIIRSMMDDVNYLRGTNENVLVMRKTRVPHLAAAGSAASTRPNIDDVKKELADCRRTVSGMARELCFRSETLSAIFRCCAELGRSGDRDGFEDRLFGDLLHLTAADWYVLRFTNADGQLVVAATSEPDLKGPPVPLLKAGEPPAGIEAAVAANRTSARFEARHTAAGTAEPLRAAGPEAHGLVYPLIFADQLVGTVAVGRRKGGWFGELQDEVVRTFAEFLAIQTVNFRHRAEEVRNRVFARELEIARDIQRSLLPLTLPQLSGFGLAGGWQAAREVGGDFYDAISLSDHSLLLVVADVMGKGVPAALFATIIRGLLRGLSTRGEGPAQLLSRLNRLLYAELSSVSMFITAQIAFVDLRRRRVTAASAGHCPLLYIPSSGDEVVALPARGIPLGVLPDTVYRHQTAEFGHPGTLLLHTDGLTDVRNPAGEMYGQQRLIDWLSANCFGRTPASELRDRLSAEMNRFRGSAPMGDDQAFLMLTEEGLPENRSAPSWWNPARFARRPLPIPVNA
ncbi:MAG TPA: SpoIIE family protein phosphatase [Opitutaceae bacterium]|jgi:serine phosphatase RsbU (regulator of sigma subunit)/anti-sigma regulatory factor (Ser/Thr protein kinase)